MSESEKKILNKKYRSSLKQNFEEKNGDCWMC